MIALGIFGHRLPHPARRSSTARPARVRARHPGSAFTLVEVMVTVAIISLLVAILLPCLSTARRHTRLIVCQSNLRNIVNAWGAYLADSHGAFLKSARLKDNVQINFGGRQGRSSPFRGPKPLNRHMNIPRVTDDAPAFRCPVDTGSGRVRPSCYEYYGSSYLMNIMLVGPPSLQIAPDDPCKPVLSRASRRIEELRIEHVSDQSRLILVGDYGWYSAFHPLLGPEFHMEWHERAMRHNVGFMDGHVSFIHFRKGIFTDSDYTLIPTAPEQSDICRYQSEVEPD